MRSCYSSVPKPEGSKLRFRVWADVWTYYKRKAATFKVAGGILLVGGVSYYVCKPKHSPDSLLPSSTSPVDLTFKSLKAGKVFDRARRAVGCFRLARSVPGWLTGWLADWLTGWLTVCRNNYKFFNNEINVHHVVAVLSESQLCWQYLWNLKMIYFFV